MAVHFGCDCGCGGNRFTREIWDKMCRRSDAAQAKLEAIGITFN
jgi:hypothetical protein